MGVGQKSNNGIMRVGRYKRHAGGSSLQTRTSVIWQISASGGFFAFPAVFYGAFPVDATPGNSFSVF